jgi:hypothetical protein
MQGIAADSFLWHTSIGINFMLGCFNIKMTNKYCKVLIYVLQQNQICMKMGSICQRIIYFSTQQYQKLNRHQVIKLLFSLTLVICLLFGQVVTAQTPNTNALVERGIKDYNGGNFANAIKNWQEALNQYKNDPSARAVVYENLAFTHNPYSVCMYATVFDKPQQISFCRRSAIVQGGKRKL